MNRRFTAKICACVLLAIALFPCPSWADATDKRDDIEKSVDRGLEFIARGQNEDGTFDSHPARAFAGVPALCGMAFLAAGHTPLSEPNGPPIMRIIDHLLEKAREDGYLGVGGGKMYSHCIATLFLSEVSGMVDTNRQAKIDILLPKAVGIILAAQNVKKNALHEGGWRYEPNSIDSDMSCSGWAVMALRSSRLNGAPVPDSAIDKAVEYILRHHSDRTGTFGYQNQFAEADKLTGAGLLCLELCGKHGHEATLRAGNYLAANYRNLERVNRRLYGLYYTSQGLFQLGGDAWKNFSKWMYGYWIEKQQPNGMWNIGEDGCPYYQTALVILSLTVPYRQLPIYQRDETVDEDAIDL